MDVPSFKMQRFNVQPGYVLADLKACKSLMELRTAACRWVAAPPGPPADEFDPGSVPVADGDTAPEAERTAEDARRQAGDNVSPPKEVTSPPRNPRRGWWRR